MLPAVTLHCHICTNACPLSHASMPESSNYVPSTKRFDMKIIGAYDSGTSAAAVQLPVAPRSDQAALVAEEEKQPGHSASKVRNVPDAGVHTLSSQKSAIQSNA